MVMYVHYLLLWHARAISASLRCCIILRHRTCHEHPSASLFGIRSVRYVVCNTLGALRGPRNVFLWYVRFICASFVRYVL